MALKRLQKEFTEQLNDPKCPLPFGSVHQTDDPLIWRAFLNGPEDSPYEGGVFELELRFSADYPINPPGVKFITSIFHSNIGGDGSICLSLFQILNWRPTDNVTTILLALTNLLANPNRNNPHGRRGQHFNDHQYYEEARRCTQAYAMKR